MADDEGKTRTKEGDMLEREKWVENERQEAGEIRYRRISSKLGEP